MAVILVVEDNPEVREFLCQTLNTAGHSLIQASNGKEALSICRSQHVDLVLTDLVMPNMEGTELIVHLRGEYPGLKVVAMSGGGLGAAGVYLRPTRHLGAKCTLPKPFSKEELFYAIEEALNSTEDVE